MKCSRCDEEAVIHIRNIIVLYGDGEKPQRIIPDGKFIPLCDRHKREPQTTYAVIFTFEGE